MQCCETSTLLFLTNLFQAVKKQKLDEPRMMNRAVNYSAITEKPRNTENESLIGLIDYQDITASI